uniref:receptor-type tyrosine-protein phosphatase C n=1 Tax=Semicossyphus pulcher TaxID=241346 RepID=UPI0037E86D49
MAGLYGLKILLLWAGLIALANCQNNRTVSALLPSRTPTNTASPSVISLSATSSSPRNMTAAPVMSSATSITAPTPPLTSGNVSHISATTPPASTLPAPTTTSDRKKTDPQTNTTQNETSPANTTGAPTTAATAEPPPSLPQCSYTVSKIQFGLRIDITSSTSGSYSINITKEARPQSGDKSKVDHLSRTSTHNITHLKPRTTYEHAVAFIDSTGKETSCNHTGKGTTELTSEMKNGDVTEGSCFPDHVCYRSEWDISSSMSASNNVTAKQCPNNDRVFCIKPGNNDTCTDLTTNFTSGNYGKSTFSLTKSITVDFLNPSEIKQKIPTGLPAKINATLPPNCKNLTVDYTCSEKSNPSESRSLWELEPFTNYTCTGQIKHNNVIVKNTTTIEFNIDCVPEEITAVETFVHNHNAINVTCREIKSFNGPDGVYIARLFLNGAQVRMEKKVKTCKFEFKDLSYSTTYRVQVTASNARFEGIGKSDHKDTLYNDKAVIGFLILLIILTSLALLLVVYKIYILRRRRSHDMGENIKLIPTINDEENLLPVEPIAADFLLEAYKRKLADEGRLFLAEFQSIPRIFSRYNVKEAKKPCNAPKNRYVDILPYDHNRVQLTTGSGQTGCDYINASFIDGYKESKKYIAAQGPKEETVCDFWRMIWEQQSSIIVMVTRCEEGNRVKCAQYWPSPERETEIFEEFIVKLNSEEKCPDYTIRRLSLTNKREKNSEREVTHIQFMSWPDHGVPGEPHLLLKLRRRVNAFKNFFSGPIVVHCSAGVGRTGTYIGIDAMMEGLEAEGRVDIYGYVVMLRRQRCLMVQVEAQYILIHQALLEHNQFGETEINLPELHSTLSTLKQKNNEPSLMEDEFERLPIFKNWRTFNSGITEENKKKNRSSSVIPYDYNRVLLKLDEGRSHDSEPDEDDEEEESSDEEDEESTKYINASHLDGYWGPRTFIAAQTPLPDTRADFWSMVYQKKASSIVMLSDCTEGEEESDCAYWDKEKKTFGDFEVEVASTEIAPTFITRNMLLRHVKRKESRPVKHFQFLKWESRELPEKPQDLTDMIKDVKHSSKSQSSNPIVVHCNDGSSRTGVFCALWNVLDSADTEKLVDVFQVVKTLRKERQGMLSSLEQYQFLYDALEGVFPVQNGDVKAAQASANDSVQIVSETKAAAEQPASTTSNGQEGAAESSPLVADGEKEDKKEETETTPMEDTSNGPTVTVEV